MIAFTRDLVDVDDVAGVCIDDDVHVRTRVRVHDDRLVRLRAVWVVLRQRVRSRCDVIEVRVARSVRIDQRTIVQAIAGLRCRPDLLTVVSKGRSRDIDASECLRR